MSLRIGVLTVSDRAAGGQIVDEGGPAVISALSSLRVNVTQTKIVPDEMSAIAQTLQDWSDAGNVDVIFTTGGTGLAPRDVTPDATLSVCNRIVPGIGEAMRREGERHTPFAMISRSVAGVRNSTLIINLPGSPKGAAEGVAVVLPILEHSVATLHGAHH